MLPDLSVLLAVVLGLLALEPPSAGDAPLAWRAIAGTVAATGVASLLARLASDRAVRHLEASEPEAARAALGWTAILPLVGWGTALYGFRWGAFVATAVPDAWFLVPFLALFAPLAVLLSAGWTAAARVEARLVPDAPSGLAAVARGLRRNALLLLPLALLLAVEDALDSLASLGVPAFRTFASWRRAFPGLEAGLLLLELATLALLAPALFRRALRAGPVPPGDLRALLSRTLDAAKVRCRDLLLWGTGRRIVNAMLVGLTGRTRYVFVSDGLLASHPPAEVAAVVLHEAGHAKKRHLTLYLVVSVALVLLVGWLDDAVLPRLGPNAPPVASLALLALLWFGVVGWLSRRFERQADVFAVDPDPDDSSSREALAERVAVFTSALERIGRVAGPGRSLRHGTLEERGAFLRRYGEDPAFRARYRAGARALVLSVLVLGAGAVALTVARLPRGIERGRMVLAVERAARAAEAAEVGDGSEGADPATVERRRDEARRARDLFLEAARLPPGEDDAEMRLLSAQALAGAADLDLRRLDRPAEAKDGYERALAVVDALPDWVAGAASAGVRFLARADLGRLALREGAGGVAAARGHLEAARAVEDPPLHPDLRAAWLRLLEAAIRLRDPAPERAAEARRELRALAAVPDDEGDPRGWRDLRRDAAAVLREAGATE